MPCASSGAPSLGQAPPRSRVSRATGSELREQPRLADARLALDREEDGKPAGQLLEARLDLCERGLPPDDRVAFGIPPPRTARGHRPAYSSPGTP
jgi:hypothetical protein